jgi:hypothetical protein
MWRDCDGELRLPSVGGPDCNSRYFISLIIGNPEHPPMIGLVARQFAGDDDGVGLRIVEGREALSVFILQDADAAGDVE